MASELRFANPGQEGIDPAFASLLGETAKEFGGLRVTSGLRSPERNRAVGGAKNSLHMHGSAADIDMSGMDETKRSTLVKSLRQRGATGFITYSDSPDTLHVDMRPGSPHFMHDKSARNIEKAPAWFQALASGKEPEMTEAPAQSSKVEAAKRELLKRKAKAELERRRAAKPTEETPVPKQPNQEFGSLTGTEPGTMERVGNALYDAGKAIGLPVNRMRGDNERLDAAVRGAADTVTAGFSDEISAGAGALTGIDGQRGNYEGNLRFQRATDAHDAEVNPVARGAGQVAGGLLLGRLAPRMAPANAIGRIKQGAGLGAAYGGAYGYGSGEGIEDRAIGGMQGAATGAAIGAAIPAATGAIGWSYNKLADATVRPALNAIRSTRNPAQNAMQLTQRSLSRDGLTPEDAAAKMQKAIDAGDDSMMLMDVAGDNTRRLGRNATNIPGEGADKLKQTVFDRQLAQPERVVAAIREGLDDPERYFGTIDDIIVQRQAAAKPLYEKAWNTPVPFTQKLEGLLGRGKVMRDALKRARDLGEAEGISSKQFFAKIADDGTYTVESVPDARQWDLMKRSLDDIIENEKTILPNGTEKLSNLGRIVSGIKREMLDEIDRVNPDYAAARKVYSSSSESLDAIEQGKKLLDADPELARRKLADMSEGDKQLARLGLSKAMTDRVQRMKDGANTVRAIFASPKHRAVLKGAFPDEKSFNGFKDAMEREAQKTRTKTAIQGNSTTAQQLTDLADNQIETGVVGNLFAGKPVAAIGAAIQKALSRATVVNSATAKELAEILTTSDPQIAQRIMQEMQRLAMKDQRVAKNLLSVRNLLRNSGIVVSTEGATAGLTK